MSRTPKLILGALYTGLGMAFLWIAFVNHSHLYTLTYPAIVVGLCAFLGAFLTHDGYHTLMAYYWDVDE